MSPQVQKRSALPGASLLAGGEGAQLATARHINTGIDASGGMLRTALLGVSGAYFRLFYADAGSRNSQTTAGWSRSGR